MKVCHLNAMTKGWFLGNFKPSVYCSDCCEVAVKKYKKGDNEKAHFHKIATEITVIIKGRVRMFNRDFYEGDIIVTEPNEVTDFEALEDTINVVVKLPSVINDKYEIGS